MYQLNKSKDAVIAHFSKEKKIETLFPENINSITPVAMNNQTENNSVHKIETLFQEEVKSILPVAIMNTQTEKPKRTYTKKIKVIEEPEFKFYLSYEDADRNTESYTDLETAKIAMKAVIEKDIYDWVQICDIGTDDVIEEWEKPEEEDEEEEEEDEEEVLLKRLAELKEAKIKKEAKSNIVQLRNEFREYTQVLINETQEKLLCLQTELSQIDTGMFDDALISKHLQKSKPKSKSEKSNKTPPKYEGKGKKAGTGEARLKDIASLNSGKIDKLSYAKKVGEDTWSLMYEGRKDGGLPVVKDSKGVYYIPEFKQIGVILGFPGMKTKKDYIDWIKS